MRLLKLINRADPQALRRLLVSASLSSLSSTAVLAVVNAASGEIAESKIDAVNWWLAAAFVASIGFYVWAESRMVGRLAQDTETAIDSIRRDLLDKLRRASLMQVERFGQAPLFESITRSTQTISHNAQFFALSIRSLILTAVVMINIAALSPLAFALISTMLLVGGWLYVKLGRQLQTQQMRMLEGENALYEGISDLFDGFKEQKLSSARSRDLGEAFNTVSETAADRRYMVHIHGWQQFIFGELAFNFMLGVVVFVVPAYAPSFTGEVVKVTASVLFMMGPLFGLMQMLAVTTEAEAAAGRMLDLEITLDDMLEREEDALCLPVPVDFHSLQLKGIGYTYPARPGEVPFSIGPIDLSVKRGDVIFITGGNGSGKSTLIRLITGLYPPQTGEIVIDDTRLSSAHLPAYRDLMATVFADFHLFPRLYGQDDYDRDRAAALMQTLEMSRVTGLDNGRFTKRDLSMGQRKRLGLIAALLQDKPVLILDEWAADQDPHFRHKFYRELLPAMKQQGLTVIAVTHDDHYFDAADRRFHLSEGRLTEIPLVHPVLQIGPVPQIEKGGA